MLFAKRVRDCRGLPTIVFLTKEWCHSSGNVILLSEKSNLVDNSIDIIALSMQVSNHAIPYSCFTSLRYPNNAIFRFLTYHGTADKERLINDIKKAAFDGGTNITIYTCHERDSKLWYVVIDFCSFYSFSMYLRST